MTSKDGNIIVLEDFQTPKHEWKQTNDPVMGGKSTGSFEVKDGLGQFTGHVAIVPFLQAPGFIKTESERGGSWPDISACEGLHLTVNSLSNYEGYRVSFGKNRHPDAFPYILGYKTDMKLDKQGEFVDVKLPFEAFTDKWDPATGDAVITCKDDNQYCPDDDTKKNLSSIAVWGEGVEGDVSLQIQTIAAYGCETESESVENSKAKSSTESSPALISEKVGDEIIIEDFSNAINTWETLNDPVMGGQSKSSVAIEDGIAHFEGKCAIVPFLKAPGFITMVTGGFRQKSASFPDVSTCHSLKVVLRSKVKYNGYYVSFGTDRAPGGRYAMGYKTHLHCLPSEELGEVVLPFSSFSSDWDDATGKTKVKCSEDQRFCPTVKTLQDMKTMSFWGEGVEGDVALDIKSISAIGCSSTNAWSPASSDVANLATASIAGNHGLFLSSANKFLYSGFWFFVGCMSMLVIKSLIGTKKQDYKEISTKGNDDDADTNKKVGGNASFV